MTSISAIKRLYRVQYFFVALAAILIGGFFIAANSTLAVVPSQGPNNPGTVSEPAGQNYWVPQDNIKISDNQYAVTTVFDNFTSGSIRATNFNFNIPVDTVITGVVVNIERKVDHDTGDTCGVGHYYSPVQDAEVKLINASGSVVGDNKATLTNYTETDTYEEHGSPADLWGVALTPDIINDSDFGVNIKVKKNGSGCDDIHVRVDHVSLTVYYSLADTTAPISAITSPSADSLLSGMVTLTAEATDTESGVALVEFWHSSPVGVKIGQTTTTPYSISLDTTTMSDGAHTIWAVAYDNAGNQAMSAPVAVTVDNTAPVISVNPQITNDQTPTITGLTDGAADIYLVVNSKTYLVNPVVAPNWFLTLPPEDALNEGDYTVNISSTDAAGNIGTGSGLLTIDLTAPALTLDPFSYNSPSLSGTTDIDASVIIEINRGNYPVTVDSGTGAWLLDVSSLLILDGPYPFTITATDSAGNQAVITGILIMDRTAPAAPNLIAPEDNTEINVNPLFSWGTASEHGSGIQYYRLEIFKNLTDSLVMVPWFSTNTVSTNFDAAVIVGFDDAPYDWQVKAVDNAGNESAFSDRWSFIKDTVNPLVSLIMPLADTVHNTSINISGSAADYDSTPMTIKYVHLYYQLGATEFIEIDTDSGLPGTQALENTGAVEPFPFNFNWTPLEDGQYNLKAVSEDKAGNFSSETIINNIIYDVTAPVITLNGSNPMSLTVGGVFTDPGASALDNLDATVAVTAAGAVNPAVVGDYIITYNAVDNAGNPAISVTRTVNVVAAPVNPSGGGGGGGGFTYCSSVVYGDWGACINGNQYRDVASRSSYNCALTSEQQLARARVCVKPVVEEQQVLGVQKYAPGTLLRSKSTHRIYIVTAENTLRYIPTLKELFKYRGRVILEVDESVIASYTHSQVLGAQVYADGTLLRSKGDHKIYVIINGEKVHIKTLKELMKYRGRAILEI